MNNQFVAPDHIDWLTFIEDAEPALAWLEAALTAPQAEILLPDAPTLWNFYWEQRIALRLRGEQVLYFYYPYFQWADNQMPTQALLRRACELTPPQVGEPRWTLRTVADSAVEINNTWCHAVGRQAGEHWVAVLQNALTLRQTGDMAQLITTLANENIAQSDSPVPALAKYRPDEEHAPDTLGSLQWWASLGLGKQSWEQGTATNNDNWGATLEGGTLEPVPESPLLSLNPGQSATLDHLHTARFVGVDAGLGAGKTYLALSWIMLNLQRQQPTLVTARNKAALQHLEQEMQRKGLGDLCLWWHNEPTDQPLLDVRIKQWEKSAIPATDEAAWATALGPLDRQAVAWRQHYQASRRKIFGEWAWVDVVGRFLHASRRVDKAVLGGQLPVTQFAYTPQEYEQLRSAILQTLPLLNARPAARHALGNLNSAIFVHHTLEESEEFIQRNSTEFLATAQRLHQQYVRRQSLYADQYFLNLDKYYRSLKTEWQNLLGLWKDGQAAYGDDMLRSTKTTLKIYGAFSEKARKAAAHKDQLLATYTALKNLHLERDAFAFSWSALGSGSKFTELEQLMTDYGQALEDWRQGLSEQVQTEMLRLNGKTAAPFLEITPKIIQLEDEFELFVDEINSSGLYQVPLQSKMLTLNRQQKFLEDTIDQLEATQAGMGDYAPFYHWQRNWFSLPELSRKVLNGLLRTRTDDWMAAFESWYFHECLNRNYAPAPLPKTQLSDYAAQANALRANWPSRLLSQWQEARKSAAAALKRSNKANVPPQKYLLDNAAAISRFCPVLLISPDHAKALLEHYPQLVVEDAHYLSVSAVQELAQAAKQCLVMEDARLNADSETDITTLLHDGGAPLVRLPAAVAHEWLGRLADMNPKVQVVPVQGRYLPQQDINTAEANAIVQWLNHIPQLAGGVYPSVGIVCLTKAQRNYLLDLLYRIKRERQPSAAAIQQMERNGLSVLAAGDVGGQVFDIVAISGVYGIDDARGNFTFDESHPLQASQAVAAVQNCLQQLPAKITVFSSWPEDELANSHQYVLQHGGNIWPGALLALRHLEHQRTGEALQILDGIGTHTAEHAQLGELSSELYVRLHDLLPDWDWQFRQLTPFSSQVLTATSPQGRHIALLSDGYLSAGTHTDPAWELHWRQQLAATGWEFLPFYAEQLWQHPSRTILRLVAQLQGIDQQALSAGVEEEE